MKQLATILLAAVALSFSGCDTLSKAYQAATTGYNLSASGQTGVVNDDAIVVNTEKALKIALGTFDTFLHVEYDNRAALANVSPKIHEWAETVRRNGKNWIKSAELAKDTYKRNRTPENHANLLTAYKTLKTAIDQSQKYIGKNSGV
jgi:hypothetical protein